jgi:hypothetical protein
MGPFAFFAGDGPVGDCVTVVHGNGQATDATTASDDKLDSCLFAETRIEQLRRLIALARRMEPNLSLVSDRELMRKQAEKYEAEIAQLEAASLNPAREG